MDIRQSAGYRVLFAGAHCHATARNYASIAAHARVFTVEEEIGCLGAKVFAAREKPEIFIAIDGSPLVPECPVELDGRPGIRSRDCVATYDQDLLREICQLSADAGVELQPVVYSGAASDASLVYSIGASPRVACLGYIRDSSHGFEVTPLRTFDHLTTTLIALFSKL